MPLSTEIFVMLIFMAAFPFYYRLLRDPQLGGGVWFLGAFGCLVISNICTVAEAFWFPDLFNFCEHLMIVLAAAMLVVAVVRLTPGQNGEARGVSQTERPYK